MKSHKAPQPVNESPCMHAPPKNLATQNDKKVSANSEKDKPKIRYSPGFWRDGYVFEQTEGLTYAHGETNELLQEYSFIGDDYDYQPIDDCPWPLAEKAIDYSSSKELWIEVRQFIWDHVYLPNEELHMSR